MGRTASRQIAGALLILLMAVGSIALWLAIPVFGGFAREAFALAAVLWLVPIQPLRVRADLTKQ